MGPDGKPLGEIATNVVFENDRVRIWNLVVEPGEASDWHLHGNDYITVVVEGSGKGVEAHYADGSVSPASDGVGHWSWHDSHAVHRLVNNTHARYKNVLIELKQASN